MTRQLTAEILRDKKIDMFATKASPKEALDFAQSTVSNAQQGNMACAILIYHNTLLEALAQELEGGKRGTSRTK